MNSFHFASITVNYAASSIPSPGRPLIPNLSNTLYRVVVLDKVTDLLLFFGKLLVVGGVGKDQGRELKEQRTGVLDSLRGDLEE